MLTDDEIDAIAQAQWGGDHLPAEQRAFARAVLAAAIAAEVSAERERCARICEAHAADKEPPYKGFEDTYLNG